jgi:hypothetical protein
MLLVKAMVFPLSRFSRGLNIHEMQHSIHNQSGGIKMIPIRNE